MRFMFKWTIAVAGSAAGSVLAWWVCERPLRLDEATALAVAGAVLTVLLAVTGWWAARERREGGTSASRSLVQTGKAGRDLNIAGRDQTIITDRRWEL
jgi:hypothetical protein